MNIVLRKIRTSPIGRSNEIIGLSSVLMVWCILLLRTLFLYFINSVGDGIWEAYPACINISAWLPTLAMGILG